MECIRNVRKGRRNDKYKIVPVHWLRCSVVAFELASHPHTDCFFFFWIRWNARTLRFFSIWPFSNWVDIVSWQPFSGCFQYSMHGWYVHRSSLRFVSVNRKNTYDVTETRIYVKLFTDDVTDPHGLLSQGKRFNRCQFAVGKANDAGPK